MTQNTHFEKYWMSKVIPYLVLHIGAAIVLELSWLNAVTVRGSDPITAKQCPFTINAAPITPIHTPAPSTGTMLPR